MIPETYLPHSSLPLFLVQDEASYPLDMSSAWQCILGIMIPTDPLSPTFILIQDEVSYPSKYE